MQADLASQEATKQAEADKAEHDKKEQEEAAAMEDVDADPEDSIEQVLADLPESENEQARQTAKRALEAFVVVRKKAKKSRIVAGSVVGVVVVGGIVSS